MNLEDRRLRAEATRILRNVLLMYKSIDEHVRALELILAGNAKPVGYAGLHAIVAALSRETELGQIGKVKLEELLEAIEQYVA